VPSELQSIADPRLLLLAWASGLALVAAAVSRSRIVGPGFTWLAAGTSALIGLAGVFADDAWWARAGLIAIVAGLALGRLPQVAASALLVGGLCYLMQASLLGGWLPSVTAMIALGGVTGEMALGHWYLVDPRLPRSALTRLAIAGIAGLVAEAALQIWLDIGVAGGGITFWILLVTSIILMAAVIGALRYPAYSGVMAATGLSYLALLTTLGAVFVGRAVTAGLGPFAR
jgi:hypothetical protein